MAKVPEHLRLMLEQCVDEPTLVLTASCGCKVSTVEYKGEQLPLVDVCPDHREDLLACTENAPAPTKYVN